jgi:hypothetical protein
MPTSRSDETSTKPPTVASSQVDERGHDVRQTSIVSPYVRGLAEIHERSSRIAALADGASGWT